MKVGDLVKLKVHGKGGARVGVTIEIIQKKCWRTHELGKEIDWSKIEPESHAVVLYSDNTTLSIPVVDLDVIQ